MGYKRGALGERSVSRAEALDQRIRSLTWLLFFLNAITFIIAALCTALTLWVRFGFDFERWVIHTGWYSYFNCNYVIMFGAVLGLINAVFAAFTLLKENVDLMLVNQIVSGVLAPVQLLGCVLILIWGLEESDVLINELREVFLDMIERSKSDDKARWILGQIEEYVGCCGAKSSQDFYDARMPVPFECRDRITGSEYRYGCQQQLAWWLEPWTMPLAAFSGYLALAGIVAIFVTSLLRKALIDYYNDYGY